MRQIVLWISKTLLCYNSNTVRATSYQTFFLLQFYTFISCNFSPKCQQHCFIMKRNRQFLYEDISRVKCVLKFLLHWQKWDFHWSKWAVCGPKCKMCWTSSRGLNQEDYVHVLSPLSPKYHAGPWTYFVILAVKCQNNCYRSGILWIFSLA